MMGFLEKYHEQCTVDPGKRKAGIVLQSAHRSVQTRYNVYLTLPLVN
ncbi:hypothetical protein NSTC731_03186 [Nostoc sp. DSM 114167]|jgi:hypothetical protein